MNKAKQGDELDDLHNISYDNIDYNKFVKKDDKQEVKKEEDLKEFYPEFVRNLYEVPRFCINHMIDHQIANITNISQSDMIGIKGSTKYLKRKTVESIKKNLGMINDHLGSYLKIIVDKDGENKEIMKRPFFTLGTSKESGKFNFVNFFKKKYFFVIENKEVKDKLKLEMQVFVLNLEKEIIDLYNSKSDFIGVQVFENGRLFAGKFSNEGKLNGDGIHITKKGNLIIGNFENSDIKRGKVITYDGIVYEGTIKDLKRHGKSQREIKEGCYEFVGDFENDKRVRGKFVYDQSNPKFKYVRNAEVEDFQKVRNQAQPFSMKLRFKYNEREHFYTGKVFNGKLCDNTAILISSKKGYPKYEGELKDNCKEGRGKYWWSLEEFYAGQFSKNKFHSIAVKGGLKEFFNNQETPTKTKDDMSLLRTNGKLYSVLFSRGDLLGYFELKENV